MHFARNLLAHVPKARADYVAAAFRAIIPRPSAEVDAAWETREEFADRFPKLGPLMDEAKPEVLAFTAFPRRRAALDLVHQLLLAGQHGDQAPLPHYRHFPNSGAVVRLIGAILIDLHDEWIAGDRRCLFEGMHGQALRHQRC